MSKSRISLLVVTLLALGTAWLLGNQMASVVYRIVAHPKPVTGPGRSFLVAAMDGGRPVLLEHEWSGYTQSYLGPAASDSDADAKTRAAARAKYDRQEGHVVFADTGRALRPLRYYLRRADVDKMNSPDCGEFHHVAPEEDITVEILDDTPASSAETVKVKCVLRDLLRESESVSIYRVRDGRVRPLESAYCEALVVKAIMAVIYVLLFVLSALAWRVLLRKAKAAV